MIDETAALRFELSGEAAHWQTATVGLADLDNFAAPDAWRALETYLGLAVRRHLSELVTSARLELDAMQADIRAALTLTDLRRCQQRVHRFRRRYLQAETVLTFYGNAVRSRTTARLGELLRACDYLAVESMRVPLRPMRVTPPPALVYLDSGLGASILRAGWRAWDGSSPSPAAAIKLTRFNLLRPTSMLHEAGHQVAHLTGWNDELTTVLRRGIPDSLVADVWAGWATELGPDLLAFAHAGYGAVAALHDVVNDARQVFACPMGDPHPVAYLRVLAGVQMCQRFYGVGPWDTLRQAWQAVYPIASAPPELQPLLVRSVEQLPRIVDLGLRTPMRAFGGAALAEIVDPTRVSPTALTELQRAAGGALTTSSHYLQAEGLRLLAHAAYSVAVRPETAAQTAEDFETWMRRLGTVASVSAAA
ncbi:hypothetical protein [Nocardia niwae]|uniref:DUF1704 domain-containing protein n=1 Tax=Nocardia niwae TaxID=626084 RepID=A0ABV2XJ28_9NOCA|nr:hypothetical protein [Nocardia niwae]